MLARQALVLYTALIVYGSWYPFSGWRSLGLGPFAYLSDPMPQYLTAFDVVTNVLGYMPFGALMVLALYPRWRGTLAVALAFVLGGLLSGVMEAVQTYLPTRVASNLDLAANALGALLGAAIIVAGDGRAARSRLAAARAASVVRARSSRAGVSGRGVAVRDDVPGAAPVRSRQLAARALAAFRFDDARRLARVDAAGLARRRLAGSRRRLDA